MLKVVYEDSCILVADKPGGMAVHPSRLHQGDTLADEVRKYLGLDEEEFVFRCITRLDKDTKGLVLIAKTLEAAQKLSEAMAARQIHREYEAVVEDGVCAADGISASEGVCTADGSVIRESGDVISQSKGMPAVNGGMLPDAGTVDAPIKRASDDPRDIRRCVDFENGERAVTHFHVTERGCGYAKVRCILETGRTHQIRVHMQYLGHPIKGDKLYDPKYAMTADNMAAPGCADAGICSMELRAVKLTFPHPLTGEVMQVV